MPTPSLKLTAPQRRLLGRSLGNYSEAARRCGVSPQAVSQVVSGANRPSPALLKLLCRAAGLRCKVETSVLIEPLDKGEK